MHLELYEACDHRPTSEHPLVQEWVRGLVVTPHRVSKVAVRELFESGDPGSLTVNASTSTS